MSRPLRLLVVALVVAAAAGALAAPSPGAPAGVASAAALDDRPAGEGGPAPTDAGPELPPATATDTGPATDLVPEPARFDGAARAVGVLAELPDEPPVVPVVLAGYSRYDGSDPLENDRRAAIYDAVLDAPGTSLSEVAATTDIHVSTVRYHVRVLDDEHLLRTAKVGGKRRLYADDVDHDAVWAALADDATAAVLAAVSRQDAASVSSLAAAVDRSTSTVSHHVTRLVDDGVLDRERAGQSVEVTIAPAVRPVVQAHVPVDESAAD